MAWWISVLVLVHSGGSEPDGQVEVIFEWSDVSFFNEMCVCVFIGSRTNSRLLELLVLLCSCEAHQGGQR